MLTMVAFPATSIKKAICVASDFSMCPGMSYMVKRDDKLETSIKEKSTANNATYLLDDKFTNQII